MKKLITICVVICAFKKNLVLFAAVVLVWGCASVFAYSGGSGTAGDPYKIGSAADLLTLAGNTGDYGAHFVLTANINLASDPCTTAIIAPDTLFIGDFDGNNHTISNLTINTSGAGNGILGLFGEIGSGGQIKNLGLIDVSITGGDNSSSLGGLVGLNYNGTISNCYSTGTVTGGSGSEYLGGLVGLNYGTISNCYSTGAVSGGNSGDLGGLTGYNHGTVSNCYSTGTVTGGSGSQYLGGLVGYNDATISNCYSTGTVTGGNNSGGLGGLVGANYNGTVSNCYSTGNVSGGDNSVELGGLVGLNYNGTISNCYSTGTVTGGSGSGYLGGLVGLNYGTISNCYSTGTVSGGSGSFNFGGLVGINDNGTITTCFWDTKTSSLSTSAGGTGKTSVQMETESTFTGWDFNDIWFINEKKNYPKLYWQIDVTKCTVTAGSKVSSDKISISGQMGAAADDFTGTIKVTINSFDIVNPCDLTFPINGTTFKNGKYNYSGTESGVRKSFTYNVKTHKFAFAASNLDLSGLDCPVTAKIEISDCNATAWLDETIVNGKKTLIPTRLMRLHKDTLVVSKAKVRNSIKSLGDSLSVSGDIAVKDMDLDANEPNLVNENVNIVWGSSTFTIPDANFKTVGRKHLYKCTRSRSAEDFNNLVTATIDLDQCTYSISVKDVNLADVDTSGTVTFGINFATPHGNFNEAVDVNLATGRSY